jgi:hypothetical protein
MRCSLKDIEAFLKVAETGSITQAAARSNTAKSILSKRISDLERTSKWAMCGRLQVGKGFVHV